MRKGKHLYERQKELMGYIAKNPWKRFRSDHSFCAKSKSVAPMTATPREKNLMFRQRDHDNTVSGERMRSPSC